jgi:hypothetical protein
VVFCGRSAGCQWFNGKQSLRYYMFKEDYSRSDVMLFAS